MFGLLPCYCHAQSGFTTADWTKCVVVKCVEKTSGQSRDTKLAMCLAIKFSYIHFIPEYFWPVRVSQSLVCNQLRCTSHVARASVRVSHYVAEAQIWPALKVLYSHKFALYRAIEHSNQKPLRKCISGIPQYFLYRAASW